MSQLEDELVWQVKAAKLPAPVRELRQCQGCGAAFVPKRIGKRHKGLYCSRKCKGAEQWQSAACRWCGVAIRFRSGDPRRYCSQSCGAKAINKPRQLRVSRECVRCGKVFQLKPSIKRKHCSDQCQAASHTGAANPNWRGGQVGKCSGCGKNIWVTPSRKCASQDAYCSVECFRRHAFGRDKPRWQTQWGKQNKRAGKRSDLGGLYVRSSWEANYARYLNFLICIGEVQSWAYEPKTFDFIGERRGAIHYTPDFLVAWKDGREEYHEVKGWMTDKGRSQLRKMGKYYPDVKVILIGPKEYKALAAKGKSLVVGWE